MAKEKAKHDGLLCFLLALIVVLILVIGGGAYYFLVVDNGENANVNSGATNLTKEEIEFFEKYFFVNEDGHTSQVNGFLNNDFDDVREIRLTDVLYTFAQGKENNEDFDKKELFDVWEIEREPERFSIQSNSKRI